MNGNEKQIKWANDIIDRAQAKSVEMQESLAQNGEKSMWADCSTPEIAAKRIEWMKSQENASAIISMATQDNWETINLQFVD